MPVELHDDRRGACRDARAAISSFPEPPHRRRSEFDITVVPDGNFDADADLQVSRRTTANGRCGAATSTRSGTVAERRGHIWQTLNPYAADSVLRIVHTLLLSREAAASCCTRRARSATAARFSSPGRRARAKRRSSALAPDDVTVLDRRDLVPAAARRWLCRVRNAVRRRVGRRRRAGERAGGGRCFSSAAARIIAMSHSALAETVRTLMRNILFFADDRQLVGRVLDTACDFASMRCRRSGCASRPDRRVWRRFDERRLHRAATRLAARKVGGEMVILSRRRFEPATSSTESARDLGGGRRPDAAAGDRRRRSAANTTSSRDVASARCRRVRSGAGGTAPGTRHHPRGGRRNDGIA